MNTVDAKTYSPRADSLPARVVAFFAKHPEEELHISDIAMKFDVPSSGIHSNLKPAVDCDLLKRNNSLYSAGQAIDLATPVAVAHAPAAAPRQKPAPKGYSSPRHHVDVKQLKVDIGVPCITHNGKGLSKWAPLFAKLTAADQSIAIPGHIKGALAAAVFIRNKQKNGTFRVAMTGCGEARIWRTE